MDTPSSRCRLCGANDREALVEELAAKMWAVCANDGRSWEDAGDYWHHAYQRRLVRLAMDVLTRAATRAEAEIVASIEVSLALHVLRPWMAVERLQDFAWHSRHEGQRRRVNGVAGGSTASRARWLRSRAN